MARALAVWPWSSKSDSSSALHKPSAATVAGATELKETIKLSRSTPRQLLGGGEQHGIQVLIVPVTEEQAADKDQGIQLNLANDAYFERLLPQPLVLPSAALADFKGKEKETHFLYPSFEGPSIIPRILLVGVGKEANLHPHKVRLCTHAALSAVRARKLDHAAMLLPTLPASAEGEAAKRQMEVLEAIARTAVLSNHSFARHLTGDNVPHKVKSLTILCKEDEPLTEAQASAILYTAQTVAECTVFAREMANDRADVITPQSMEELARVVASTHQLKLTVLHEKELRKQGYNLITAVGQGAKEPPRIVVLEYNGAPESQERIALVGKGITFDSGGLNLKPTGHIENMHLDMSGAAAVLATIKAAAMLGIKTNVVAALALAENAIGPNAQKPLTILHSAKGSVEVANTDAEGRLALADAFSYVQKHHKPTVLVDMATLTGACVVALGEYAAGLFSNSDRLQQQLVASGTRVFERVWPLPILPEHTEELKATFADMRSTGKDRYGGACTAAAFLQKFVDEGVEWAHVDIAGPAMYSRARDFMPEGGTGFGVQLLVDFIQSQAGWAEPQASLAFVHRQQEQKQQKDKDGQVQPACASTATAGPGASATTV